MFTKIFVFFCVFIVSGVLFSGCDTLSRGTGLNILNFSITWAFMLAIGTAYMCVKGMGKK